MLLFPWNSFPPVYFSLLMNPDGHSLFQFAAPPTQLSSQLHSDRGGIIEVLVATVYGRYDL